MTTAQRVKSLFKRHGDSVREASRKTGVPRETLRRLLEGSEANLDKWVPMIAGTYGVPVAELLGGLDPKSDFEWTIRHASIAERTEMVAMTLQQRVHLALTYLARTHQRACSPASIAAQAGLAPAELDSLLALWRTMPPDLITTRSIAQAINTITKISARWLEYGLLEDEPGVAAIGSRIPQAYLAGETGWSAQFGANHSKDQPAPRAKDLVETMRRRLSAPT